MNQLNLSPFPVLTTSRLKIRRLSFEDEKEIFAIRSDKEIAKYLDRPLCENSTEAGNFIGKVNSGIDKNECVYWAVTIKEDPKLIGTICLWNFSEDKFTAEIGFEILPEYQGKGIMSEALAAVIDYGFNTIYLKSIEGEVDPENMRSIKLMERHGFKLLGSIRETDSDDVKSSRTVIYKLISNRS